MSWREECERVLAQVHATIPADADVKARRKALKGKGWAAHQGTLWGRKMWGRVVREYLARHGAEARLRPDELPLTQLDLANAELRARRGASS